MSWKCMDRCKFLVLNDLRNSCRDDCCFVACLSLLFCSLLHSNCVGLTSGIIDGIIYLPLARQILSSFPTTLLHFPTPQVLALKTYTWCACLEVCNWSFNSFGQVKIQHYSNSSMLPPFSLSE